MTCLSNLFVPGKLYIVTTYFREKNKANTLWDSKNPNMCSKKYREGLGTYRNGLKNSRIFKEIACGEIVMWLGEGADPLEKSNLSVLYSARTFHLADDSLKYLNQILVPATMRTFAQYRK